MKIFKFGIDIYNCKKESTRKELVEELERWEKHLGKIGDENKTALEVHDKNEILQDKNNSLEIRIRELENTYPFQRMKEMKEWYDNELDTHTEFRNQVQTEKIMGLENKIYELNKELACVTEENEKLKNQ